MKKENSYSFIKRNNLVLGLSFLMLLIFLAVSLLYLTQSQVDKQNKLLLEEQVELIVNTLDKYSLKDQYDYIHPANQLILQAISILPQFTKSTKMKSKASVLKSRFPAMPSIKMTDGLFDKLVTDKNLSSYQDALNLSYLILKNYQPDFRCGGHPALAILFDMNLLFENFIYHQLKNVCQTNL